jgi:hypothetical protein
MHGELARQISIDEFLAGYLYAGRIIAQEFLAQFADYFVGDKILVARTENYFAKKDVVEKEEQKAEAYHYQRAAHYVPAQRLYVRKKRHVGALARVIPSK